MPLLPDPSIDQRARRDGCGCPAWVIRCAHFGDRFLLLGDSALVSAPAKASHARGKRIWPVELRHEEQAGPCDAECLCGGGGDWFFDIPPIEWGEHDTFEAAVEDFVAKEARLLGREASS